MKIDSEMESGRDKNTFQNEGLILEFEVSWFFLLKL